ncbi:hypothetical protein F8M41_013321 [Gigaspora margarita]|uniref:Uncharacterized protein n=1 Tax=Gigaspora margarita TaxID=4874 RepID=A0A8H4ASC3_GIGMA|nr:hypothetical protein F8M41_013321 [Gigaspora margarita]
MPENSPEGIQEQTHKGKKETTKKKLHTDKNAEIAQRQTPENLLYNAEDVQGQTHHTVFKNNTPYSAESTQGQMPENSSYNTKGVQRQTPENSPQYQSV